MSQSAVTGAVDVHQERGEQLLLSRTVDVDQLPRSAYLDWAEH
jgi:hypothetical protein